MSPKLKSQSVFFPHFPSVTRALALSVTVGGHGQGRWSEAMNLEAVLAGGPWGWPWKLPPSQQPGAARQAEGQLLLREKGQRQFWENCCLSQRDIILVDFCPLPTKPRFQQQRASFCFLTRCMH